MLQRQLSVPASASAVAPEAATGAYGNGSRSTSLVTRNSAYPSPIQLRRPQRSVITRRKMGVNHSGFQSCRPATAALAAFGTAHVGIWSAMGCAAGDAAKYACQIRFAN